MLMTLEEELDKNLSELREILEDHKTIKSSQESGVLDESLHKHINMVYSAAFTSVKILSAMIESPRDTEVKRELSNRSQALKNYLNDYRKILDEYGIELPANAL